MQTVTQKQNVPAYVRAKNNSLSDGRPVVFCVMAHSRVVTKRLLKQHVVAPKLKEGFKNLASTTEYSIHSWPVRLTSVRGKGDDDNNDNDNDDDVVNTVDPKQFFLKDIEA